MNCPRCDTSLPAAAHFCHACGQDATSQDTVNRQSFAIKPNEPVRSFRLVSTIMPKGASQRPGTYQIALGIALAATVLSTLLGAIPIALMLAAFAIPIVYIVYLYDVNLWEDQPIPVTGLAFLLTFVLAIGFTAVWVKLRGPLPGAEMLSGGGISVTGLLVSAVLVPVVGELIRQIGPVVLAARPEFDDLMDGLTFGIISGVAFSTADTLVRNWDLISYGFTSPGAGAGTWTTLLVLEGFIKPLVIGTATGIACAEFSGLGHGYDGFTPRYFLAAVEAVGWNILYFGGSYLFSKITPAWLGILVAIVWGLILLAALIIRVRGVLQTGLMEAALESAARHDEVAGVGEGELEFCGACEMPMMAGAAFCSACGTSERGTIHPKRPRPTAAETLVAAPAVPVAAGVSLTEAAAPATPARVVDSSPNEVAGLSAPGAAQPNPEQARLDDEEAK